MLELSAEDAEPLIRAGWPKLAELPEDDLPGYDDNYIDEPNEPQGPQPTYAFGSVEWEIENKKALAASKAAEEAREKRRLGLAAFRVKKS